MSERSSVPVPPSVSRSQVLFTGAVLGAVAGLVVSYMLLQRAEEAQKPLKLDAKRGMRLGFLLMGWMRQMEKLLVG